MTEAEWNTAPIEDLLLYTLDIHRARYGAEPEKSFRLQGPLSALRVDLARKHVLLAYGILRYYWNTLDPDIQEAVDTLEAYEEPPNTIPDPPLDDFGHVMDLFLEPLYRDNAGSETSMAMWLIGGWWPEVKSTWKDQKLPESWRQYVHDIFGNPFRPAAVDPAWLRWNDGAAVAIAQKMYDERDFTSTPVLADALEEAGCTSADILEHCRRPAEHVRGCWVVDLVLGKE